MKKIIYQCMYLVCIGVFTTSANAVDLLPGTSQTVNVNIKGTVTQRMSCTVDVGNSVDVTIPAIEYKDIKTEEQVATLQPLMTTNSPTFTSFTTTYNQLLATPGYAETPEIGVDCEYGGGKSLLSVSLDPSTSWNGGASDLLITATDAPGLDAQGKKDYATVLRLATFLYVTPASQTPVGYRLDLANMGSLNSKLTPFSQGHSSFKVGFVLYRRTTDKSNGFSFANWRPPVQNAPFTATLPLTLNFN